MKQEQIDNLLFQAYKLENQARNLRFQAEQAKMVLIKKDTTMQEWLGYLFESSSGLTKEFALFARQFKKTIISQMIDYELKNWGRGHFYISGFFQHKKTKKFIYFSTPDVRFFKDEWYNNILIRVAKNEKDYTGGNNWFINFQDLKKKADKLTK